MDELTRKACGLWDIPDNYMVSEDCWCNYPNLPSTTNALRFLAPEVLLTGFDGAYYTDVDFIFLPHEPDFCTYYHHKTQAWDECYWGKRGPNHGLGNSNAMKRIAGGCFFAVPQWYKKTSDLREKMLAAVKAGKVGDVREDDERMLWDICAGSGLQCPTRKTNCRKQKYKEIHLGDFKFKGRWTSNKKMRKRINMSNVWKWFRLNDDKAFEKIKNVCCEDDRIAELVNSLDEYMNKRVKAYREYKARLHNPDLSA